MKQNTFTVKLEISCINDHWQENKCSSHFSIFSEIEIRDMFMKLNDNINNLNEPREEEHGWICSPNIDLFN